MWIAFAISRPQNSYQRPLCSPHVQPITEPEIMNTFMIKLMFKITSTYEEPSDINYYDRVSAIAINAKIKLATLWTTFFPSNSA